MNVKRWIWVALVVVAMGAAARIYLLVPDCEKAFAAGFRPVAASRLGRFLGKVTQEIAGCRGGEGAIQMRLTPWVDWQKYWGTGDVRSRGRIGSGEDQRGILGALVDLEYQRVEL